MVKNLDKRHTYKNRKDSEDCRNNQIQRRGKPAEKLNDRRKHLFTHLSYNALDGKEQNRTENKVDRKPKYKGKRTE